MSELQREQVEYICKFLVEEHLSKDASTILNHDAALRATIERQAQELQDERDKIASMRNSFPVDAASWRGVDEHDVCAECGGAGTKLYGNTSTYHYSAGGQAMTLSVCDKCWGSGNKQKPWRSWKLVEQQAQELEKLKKELNDEVQTSLKYLGERNEKIKDLAAMTRERAKELELDVTHRDRTIQEHIAKQGELQAALAAREARIAELEKGQGDKPPGDR